MEAVVRRCSVKKVFLFSRTSASSAASGVMKQFTFSKNAIFQPATVIKRTLFKGHFNPWNISCFPKFILPIFKKQSRFRKTFCNLPSFFFLSSCRSSHRMCSIKKLFLNIFQYSQHLYWSLFLINLQAWRLATLLKRDPDPGVFLWILQNFEEQLFWRWSANGYLWSSTKILIKFSINKNMLHLKLVSAIYQIFIFHQMIALQKIWKLFFYFI